MRALAILLIEDNQDHAFLTRKVLGQSERVKSIRVVTDGSEAMRLLEGGEDGSTEEMPDLILLDVKLPREDGFEVLRRIRLSSRAGSIPVVLLTTSARDEEIARGYRLGANSYVTKPIQFEEFSWKMRQIEQYWSRVSELPEHPVPAAPGGGA